MHKLTSGALVVALTGTAVTVPATINPTAHYAEAQGLLGLGGQALQGLVEKGEAKVAELESQLWKAELALKGAQALMEMKRWGVVLAIGEENKKAKQAEYDQQKLLVDSAELLVRTTKTSLDAARKTLAVTKKQLEDFNGKDPSAYEDAPEPDTKPLTLPTNLREALESITAQQEAVAKRQALFDEADSAYTKRKKEVDSSWFSWLAPSNTKELEGLKNRRDARKAKLDLEQARLENITRSIELFEAVEAETPAHDGHGADRYDATTPTNVDDASRQLEFANSTLEAATHRKANIEANLAALTGWQERNPFTGFWHNADKWTLERALRAADNEITDATKRIADKAAALEELKNAPAETEPSAPEVETPGETTAAEPTEDSAPRTPETTAPEAAPEPSESEAHAEPESPETSSEETTATSTPATTSTPTSEESAPRTPEASESVEPADTSAEPEDQIDIDELTQNLDEAKKLEQDMLDLQKLLQQYINKPEAETTKPSETEVSPTTVTEVSVATPAPATTAAPTSSEVSAARTTEETEPAAEDSAARTTEETAPTADSSAARTTPTEIPSSEQSAARTTTSAKLSTVAEAPATSSEVSAARTTEETEPAAEDSAAQTTEAAKPTTQVSAATSTPATTSAPTSEVSAARTTTSAKLSTVDVTPTTSSEVSAARTTPTEIPSSQQSAPRTTEAAKPTTEVSAATSTPATRPGSSAPRTTSQAPETTQQAKPTQQTEGAASGAKGSSASSWLWLILPLLLALGFGGAAYADLIPGVRLPRM